MHYGAACLRVTGAYIYARIGAMTPPFTLHRVALGLMTALLVADATALSLDRPKGTAWLGKPLELSVRVGLDAGEDPNSLCASADVFYGETRVNSARVQVSSAPAPEGGAAILRIQSSQPVDEPVLTLYVKAGCGQGLSRRYVLLTELPVDPEPVAAPTVSSVVRRAPPTAIVAVPAASGPATAGRADESGVPVPAVAKRAHTPRTATRAAARPPSVVRVRPRLRLDPAELVAEREPSLRASREMLSAPDESGGQRRAEALALWRAINAAPEDILKTEQQLLSLKAEVESLRRGDQTATQAITQLRGQLEEAEAARYHNPVLYGLAAGLLAALAAAVYFWRRGSEAGRRPWWGGGSSTEQTQDGALSSHAASLPGGVSASELAELSHLAPSSRSASQIPAAVKARGVAKDDSEDPTGFDRLGFEPSGAGRAVKVDELFDVQQQADFFLSLGQYDQAVATLRDHILEHPETSALAYLDLLEIFHLQGREREFDLVREEFNKAFNADVPPFEAFGHASRGLEQYEAALSRIVSLWPTPRVLDVIEESILRKPGGADSAFDLEAYRELLLLYAMAKDLVEHPQGPSQAANAPAATATPAAAAAAAPATAAGPTTKPTPLSAEPAAPKFEATAIQPLAATPVASGAPVAPVPAGADDPLRVPPSPKLGLDIDLSEFVESSADAGVPTVPPAANLIDFDFLDSIEPTRGAVKKQKG